MVTNAQFLTAFQGFTIPGVKVKNEPPRAINTADLPVGFPMLPRAELGGTTFSCLANNKTRSMQFVICLEAAGQGTQTQNYALLAPMLDSLESELDGLGFAGGGTTAIWIDYTIVSGTVVDVAGVEYWAVVADVTARDV